MKSMLSSNIVVGWEKIKLFYFHQTLLINMSFSNGDILGHSVQEKNLF